MTRRRRHDRSELREIARRAMRERGLWPDFDPSVAGQLKSIDGPARERDPAIRDLTGLAWASIDNEDSRDLDQVTTAEAGPDGSVRVRVAVADVDALVSKGTPIDRHAEHNTTSVYTGVTIFPMLPERLSTNLTSLNPGEDRQALVMDLEVDRDGHVTASDVYRARVRNKAKLAYPQVARWLEGRGPAPRAMAAVRGLDLEIRLQDKAARALRRRREERGALDLQTLEPKPVFDGETVTGLRLDEADRARDLIEDLMIAANGAMARFLEQAGMPALRRVVRLPERWPRIVDLAAGYGTRLPMDPDPVALEAFLVDRHAADPRRFPDLCLVIVKLMGRGEYVVEKPGQKPIGHFGLAVRAYTHSTAPNRRFPDLLAHRLAKAAFTAREGPYGMRELEELAQHCTEQENAANKVERRVRKSAAALLLETRLGERFPAIVTGASAKGTWVRIVDPPIEGKLVEGFEDLDVGDELEVELVLADVERGYIDFVRVRGR